MVRGDNSKAMTVLAAGMHGVPFLAVYAQAITILESSKYWLQVYNEDRPVFICTDLQQMSYSSKTTAVMLLACFVIQWAACDAVHPL